MANSKYKAEVVRYLRKKTNGGYTEAPTYLGSEQKFVGALRNSNDNNLEEQFLLGTDCLTTEWEDNGNSYILVMKELLKEKDEEIERLKKELSEKEQTIKELKEKLQHE